LQKSPALIAFDVCLKSGLRFPPSFLASRVLALRTWPTPLEPMKRLTKHLGGPRLWVKREDAAGVGFGGNKLRNEAMAGKVDTLVSGGVVQSNSQLQVAAAAAEAQDGVFLLALASNFSRCSLPVTVHLIGQIGLRSFSGMKATRIMSGILR
jgi:1-aminocyclopropane-1-carboxylate deaminase/D-cysteine desulfhydrase-like pyridoxal-dependent ACC family enzyme